MLPRPVITISRQHVVFERDMPKAEGAMMRPGLPKSDKPADLLFDPQSLRSFLRYVI